MQNKKTVKSLAIVIVLLLICICGLKIYQANAFAALPDAFCVYSGSQGKDQDYDFQSIMAENGKQVYHVNALEECLCTEGSYVYVTGNYYHSFYKPKVYLDGQKLDVKTSGNGGILKHGRLYHFYIENVVPDYKYNISVTCGKEMKNMDVIFHRW